MQSTADAPSTKGDLPITLYLKLQIFIAPISVKKHNIVDWYISYFAVLCDISFVRYNECFFDMIIFVLNKCVQCTMHGIVLTGLNFNWHGRKAIIIINKIINLTLAAIVIIKEFMTVSD